MSMEMDLRALPRQSDYKIATDLVNESFNRQGGPWVAAYREEKRALGDVALFDLYTNTGMIANDMEPLDMDDRPIDPLLRTTHAFKHGMLAGYKVTDILHEGIIQPLAAIGSIAATVIDIDSQYGRGSQLVDLGERGLDMAGGEASDTIESWSNEVVSDERARRMYSLGCGAVLFAAYKVHSAHNEIQVQRYFQQYQW